MMYEVTNFLWPVLMLFQLVISIIAVRKLKGVGPLLMLAGTTLTVLNSLNTYLGLVDLDTASPDSPELWGLMAVNFTSRVLFFTGLLLVILKVYKTSESVMGRTEF